MYLQIYFGLLQPTVLFCDELGPGGHRMLVKAKVKMNEPGKWRLGFDGERQQPVADAQPWDFQGRSRILCLIDLPPHPLSSCCLHHRPLEAKSHEQAQLMPTELFQVQLHLLDKVGEGEGE